MAGRGDSNKEMINSEGTDKYEAGAYTVAGDTLLGPIYGVLISSTLKITVLKDKNGDDLVVNYLTEGIDLLAGEQYFFRNPVHAITFTTGDLQVFYQSQKKQD